MRHAALAVLSMAMAVSGCSHKPPPAEDVRPVQTVVAGRVSAALGATYSGAIAARNQSDQAFRVAGTVVKRLVDVGQHVAANQALIQLDPANPDLNAQAGKAQLDAARSKAAQSKVNLDRDAELLKQEFISQAEYDRDKAVSQIEMAQSQYGEASNQAGYGTLRAAVPGIVTAINVDVGQVVNTA